MGRPDIDPGARVQFPIKDRTVRVERQAIPVAKELAALYTLAAVVMKEHGLGTISITAGPILNSANKPDPTKMELRIRTTQPGLLGKLQDVVADGKDEYEALRKRLEETPGETSDEQMFENVVAVMTSSAQAMAAGVYENPREQKKRKRTVDEWIASGVLTKGPAKITK